MTSSTLSGPKVAVLGMSSSHGGTIITAGSATLDGTGIARTGDLHSCPIPEHGITPLTATAPSALNGVRIVRVGDSAGCGAVITG